MLRNKIILHIILLVITINCTSNVLAMQTMQPNGNAANIEFMKYNLHKKEYYIKKSALQNIENKRQEISNSNYYNNMVVYVGTIMWSGITGNVLTWPTIKNTPTFSVINDKQHYYMKKDNTTNTIGTLLGAGIGYLISAYIMPHFLQQYNEKDIMPAYLELEEAAYFDTFIKSNPNQYK